MTGDRPISVLLLAGTAEAAALAEALHRDGGFEVTSSFAGRTSRPKPPPGAMRVGGFGGIDGLADVLRTEAIDVLVDATHPFAATMPHHAAAAAAETGVPRLRVLRPPWRPRPGDRWDEVADLTEAAARLEAVGARRVLLSTGRHELAPFTPLTAVHFVVRSIDPPDPLALPDATVLLARGPFTLADEIDLLRTHRIDTLVTKNSGGTATAAKLEAARDVGARIVMVRRPDPPPGPQVETVTDALAWIERTR